MQAPGAPRTHVGPGLPHGAVDGTALPLQLPSLTAQDAGEAAAVLRRESLLY